MFSVIIPTKNEERYLPRLLRSIKKQKLQPTEVIVSDNSADSTRDIARHMGCTVVNGGTPSVARNNGARAATQDILVFLDADTELPNHTAFNQMIGTFIAKDADIGSCYGTNVKEEDPYPKATHFILNTTKRINKLTSKTINRIIGEFGFNVICTREFFEKIGGFREDIRVTEDTEFFTRAVKSGGKYIVIPLRIGVSDRRFAKREFKSSLKISLLLPVVLAGMFLGIKGWRTIMDKYDKEKGELGGGKTTPPKNDSEKTSPQSS